MVSNKDFSSFQWAWRIPYKELVQSQLREESTFYACFYAANPYKNLTFWKAIITVLLTLTSMKSRSIYSTNFTQQTPSESRKELCAGTWLYPVNYQQRDCWPVLWSWTTTCRSSQDPTRPIIWKKKSGIKLYYTLYKNTMTNRRT